MKSDRVPLDTREFAKTLLDDLRDGTDRRSNDDDLDWLTRRLDVWAAENKRADGVAPNHTDACVLDPRRSP
jgi:hypothetical protein